MPTYEFRCANGHTFDQFHKISEAPSTATCPICGAEAERAISGGAGLVFKGSGFYLTDYGKNAHRSGSSAPAKGDSKSEGGDSGGKDSGRKDSGGKGESAGSKEASGSTGSSSGSSGASGSGGTSSSSSSGSSTGGTGGGTAGGTT